MTSCAARLGFLFNEKVRSVSAGRLNVAAVGKEYREIKSTGARACSAPKVFCSVICDGTAALTTIAADAAVPAVKGHTMDDDGRSIEEQSIRKRAED